MATKNTVYHSVFFRFQRREPYLLSRLVPKSGLAYNSDHPSYDIGQTADPYNTHNESEGEPVSTPRSLTVWDAELKKEPHRPQDNPQNLSPPAN